MLLCRPPQLEPVYHLALDEALLEQSEAAMGTQEWLRIWELAHPAVVVGRSSRIEEEVDLQACRRDRIPVLRRCTGGGAVLLAPGCLVYSTILSLTRRPFLREPAAAHRWVLEHVRRAIIACQAGHITAPEEKSFTALDVSPAGTSDLAAGGRKISGNSMKIKRHAVLYHGTILYAASLSAVSEYLLHPPREPDYRENRRHDEFISNLPVDDKSLREQLVHAFGAHVAGPWPETETRRLVQTKYGRPPWTVC